MNRVGKIIATCIFLLSSNCTDNIAGNSSETNNGVTIVASNARIEGFGSNIFKVYIFSSNYNPVNRSAGSCDSAFTDSTGNFSFNVTTGTYNVLCLGKDGKQSFTTITVERNIQNDTIHSTLQITGSFIGKSTKYFSTQTSQHFFFILGSPYYSKIDETGNFRFSSVAPGDYLLSLFSDSLEMPTTSHIVTVKMITIKSDTTIQVQW